MIMEIILKINQSEFSLMLDWFLAARRWGGGGGGLGGDGGERRGIKGCYRAERSLKCTMHVKADLGQRLPAR